MLTEEQKTDAYPPASMETAQSSTEEALYSNVTTTRFAKASISGYPVDSYTSPNDYVAKTNGSGNKLGPAILLKVMAGDRFNLRVSSWYKLNGTTPDQPVDPFQSWSVPLPAALEVFLLHMAALPLQNCKPVGP